jgi:hypothetical protein
MTRAGAHHLLGDGATQLADEEQRVAHGRLGSPQARRLLKRGAPRRKARCFTTPHGRGQGDRPALARRLEPIDRDSPAASWSAPVPAPSSDPPDGGLKPFRASRNMAGAIWSTGKASQLGDLVKPLLVLKDQRRGAQNQAKLQHWPQGG